MESCGMSIIKYILFIFNLFFAISGLGIIIAGAIVLADVTEYDHFASAELLAPPIVLIVAGAIVFIVAFLGCFGAIRESYNMLIAFAVCLLLIFILELAAGIAAAVYKSDFQDALQNTLRKSLANYTQSDIEKISWDKSQTKLQCCGVNGPEDWQGQVVPRSCCHNMEGRSDPFSNYCISNAYGKYLYQAGCYDTMKNKFDSNATIVIGTGIGIAFIEIIGIILACWLAHTVKREQGAK